jgi:hypothetical protein
MIIAILNEIYDDDGCKSQYELGNRSANSLRIGTDWDYLGLFQFGKCSKYLEKVVN